MYKYYLVLSDFLLEHFQYTPFLILEYVSLLPEPSFSMSLAAHRMIRIKPVHFLDPN